MIYKTFFAMVITFIVSGCKTGNMGHVKYGEDGKIVSGESKTRCTPPTKRYTKDLELKVRAEVDSLSNIPIDKMELGLKQTVTRLADYTSQGLDLDLFLFRICEMANNRGLGSKETDALISKAIEAYNSNEDLKKKSSN